MANGVKNGYKKLFDKLVYGLFVIVILGFVGIGKHNFDCDAQREVDANVAREKIIVKQEQDHRELKQDIKDDITEIKDDMKELKKDMKDDMKEIKRLIRSR